MPESFGDGLRKFTDNVKRKVDAINKQGKVSFPELFNPAFMRRHTKMATIEEFFDASGFEVNSAEDFEAIPDDAWEKHVTTHTSFRSWEEMQKVAGEEWIAAKLKE